MNLKGQQWELFLHFWLFPMQVSDTIIFCNIFSDIHNVFLDKNPPMNEFLAQIKSTSDLQVLFESIQKDSASNITDSANQMDLS